MRAKKKILENIMKLGSKDPSVKVCTLEALIDIRDVLIELRGVLSFIEQDLRKV